MAQIDKIKEKLNNLRVLFSLIIGVLIALTSGLINRFDKIKSFDTIFISGLLFEFFLFIILIVIGHKLNKNTEEIGDL